MGEREKGGWGINLEGLTMRKIESKEPKLHKKSKGED